MLGKQTKSALAIPVPSDKEPAGRRASGLAHLMTALHQNAAAVVNSKTQLNGPDQVSKISKPDSWQADSMKNIRLVAIDIFA